MSRAQIVKQLGTILGGLLFIYVASIGPVYASYKASDYTEKIKNGDRLRMLADNLYLVTKGRVEVVNSHPSGHDVMLGELGLGECFGEIGLLLGRPRNAIVRAKAESAVEVMALGRESFARLIAESGETREELVVIMSKRILATAEKLNPRAGRTP